MAYEIQYPRQGNVEIVPLTSYDGGQDCSSSTNGATIAIIVIVSLLVLALIVVLIVQAVNRNKRRRPVDSVETEIAQDVNAIRKDLEKSPSVRSNTERAHQRPMHPQHLPMHQRRHPQQQQQQQRPYPQQQQQQQRPYAPPMRANGGRRYGVADPTKIQHHEPIYDNPAAMPRSQLMSPPNMPETIEDLPGVPSSNVVIGDAEMDIMSTEQQGTSANPYSDGNYLMDPGMMTPSSATDIKGLQTFMPYMGGGIGGKEEYGKEVGGGPVDPSTGLPLFTTGKLIRSQLLGGHGAGSFLRQVQDPLSGYRKSVGKMMCGVQQGRRDIEVRRKQFNAARLEHPDADPVLFNVGDFAYSG
jgi:hypothetical protein